jgi:hypothetical protein
MALLGWLFIGWPFLPAGQIDSYIAGLIILAAPAEYRLPQQPDQQVARRQRCA